MKTFRVYFTDGNQKLYKTFDLEHLVKYLKDWTTHAYTPYNLEDIYKIERAEEEDDNV